MEKEKEEENKVDLSLLSSSSSFVEEVEEEVHWVEEQFSPVVGFDLIHCMAVIHTQNAETRFVMVEIIHCRLLLEVKMFSCDESSSQYLLNESPYQYLYL